LQTRFNAKLTTPQIANHTSIMIPDRNSVAHLDCAPSCISECVPLAELWPPVSSKDQQPSIHQKTFAHLHSAGSSDGFASAAAFSSSSLSIFNQIGIDSRVIAHDSQSGAPISSFTSFSKADWSHHE
jgi:hypothetical protein